MDNFQSQILKKGGGGGGGEKKRRGGGGGGGGDRKKMSTWGNLEFLPWIFTWGLILLKILLKMKYGFEGSISNVDLGLF